MTKQPDLPSRDTTGGGIQGGYAKSDDANSPHTTKPITAVVYRTEAQKVVDEFEKVNYNDSDQVQFELAVFSDGRVAQRWLVGAGSCVWWDRLEDLYRVHIYAHPDYGTRVEWSNGKVEQL